MISREAHLIAKRVEISEGIPLKTGHESTLPYVLNVWKLWRLAKSAALQSLSLASFRHLLYRLSAHEGPIFMTLNPPFSTLDLVSNNALHLSLWRYCRTGAQALSSAI